MIFGAKAEVKVKKTLAVLSTEEVPELQIKDGDIIVCENLEKKHLEESNYYYVCEKKGQPFFGKVSSILNEDEITFEVNGNPENSITLGEKSIDEVYRICHKITNY